MQINRQSTAPQFSPCNISAGAESAASLKSAIRLGDFWAAFGARGMVALAWTLGAMNAPRIRNETGRFPLLQMTAQAGSGQSLLLGYLAKLSGKDQFGCYVAERITQAGMTRALATAGEPIVFELESKGSDLLWDQLKPLYGSAAVALQRRVGTSVESFTFSGALILVRQGDAFPPSSIQNRSVEVQLQRPQLTPARRAAADALNSMLTSRAGHFQAVAAGRCERIVALVKERASGYSAELKDAGWSAGRDAANHGQLLALLDALAELIDLSQTQLEAIRREIRFMSMDVPY